MTCESALQLIEDRSGLTSRQSQRPQPSRFLLRRKSRRLRSWLTCDVGQKMKVSIAGALSVDGVAMSVLSMPALRRAFGKSDTEEKITLHGGNVRFREIWSIGVSTLRDEEEEAVCLSIDPGAVQVLIADEALPDLEREFVKRFPAAQKALGHSYMLIVETWRLHVNFARPQKRRGAGSTVRHLSQVIVSKTEPNQSSEPTPTAGTSAAEQPLVPTAVVAHL